MGGAGCRGFDDQAAHVFWLFGPGGVARVVEHGPAGAGEGRDTAACANALNLRAYRERRKAARFSDLSERDPG